MSWLSSHWRKAGLQIWLVCVVAFEPQHGCVTVLILFHAPVPFLTKLRKFPTVENISDSRDATTSGCGSVSGRGFLLQEVHCCVSLMVFAVRMSVAILDFSQSSLNVMERITAFI